MAEKDFYRASSSFPPYKLETVTKYVPAYVQFAGSGHSVSRTIRVPIKPTFFQVLNKIMDYQNLSINKLMELAEVDRGVYYQIEKGEESERQTILQIVLALQLGFEETKEFLKMKGIYLDENNIKDALYAECVKSKYTVHMYKEILQNRNNITEK